MTDSQAQQGVSRRPLPRAMWPTPGQVPAVPRDAATILLLRDGVDGTETYLLRRQASVAFAAGMYVFPGGTVQAGDGDDLPWVGPDPDWWAERFRCPPALARALVVAAVRETFEESGILLAGPDAHTIVDDVSDPAFAQARLDLDAGERSLADFLDEHGLVLRADLVGPWAHWITPAAEPRRYDTRFLVAAVPAGQRVGSLPGEADRAEWVPVHAALAAAERGEVAMMPPTVVTARSVADIAARDVVAAATHREFDTVEPRMVEVDGAWYLETVWEDS